MILLSAIALFRSFSLFWLVMAGHEYLETNTDPNVNGAMPLAGPFSTLEAGCAKLGLVCYPNQGWDTKRPLRDKVGRADVLLFSARRGEDRHVRFCLVGIRTKTKKWFLGGGDYSCFEDHQQKSVVPVEMSVMRVESIDDVVAIRWTEETRRRIDTTALFEGGNSSSRRAKETERFVGLCGVGKSGRPACTRGFLIGCTDDEGKSAKFRWELVTGKLSVSNIDDALCGLREVEDVVGTKAVSFP